MASTFSTAPQSQVQITYAFHGLGSPFASASTSATSSSPLKKLPFDVFLNHHGPNVKYTLPSATYISLHKMGLSVFLDLKDPPLEYFFPRELQEAMTSASLYVAIFSTPYAQSPWCLADLSLMLKSGISISPICYLVQPDVHHLVHEKRISAADLLKHQKKGIYSTDKLEEWKLVFHKALFYKGENINNNGQEQMVLKNIVSHVLEVMKRVRLDVVKHHEAIEEVLTGFESTVGESTKAYPDVQMVGIWGMGGSGKITLPKKLSNV